MQTTSALWKQLWASGSARLETVAVIAGVEYADISAPVINRALMQGGLTIGNAVSATCNFTVRNAGTVPRSAEVVIKKRLTDGAQSSEWLTSGTFYVAHRSRNAVTGELTLECYDALLKANADMPALMPWTTEAGEPMTTESGEMLYFSAHYPRKMAAVMRDIALILGDEIRIDPSTQIETGDEYVIDAAPPGTHIVDVLKKIAAANGGNWIMTPDNMLKLVPLISASGAEAATENVVDVDGVLTGIGTAGVGTVTGIRYTENGEQKVAGDETGLVLEADVNASVAADLLEKLGGMTYQAFDLSGAVYDPAAELGDYVRAGANGEINAVIYSESATLAPAFRGNISAPELGEFSDEYPYLGKSASTLALARQYADDATQRLDDSLTQQEIFDRLTDDGQTQGISLKPVTNPGPSAATPKRIFINVDYVDEGEMAFDHLHGGTMTLGGANNIAGLLRLLDAEGAQVCLLDENGVEVSRGNITSYSADQLTRALVSVGRIALQYYGQDAGTGLWEWLDALSMIVGETAVALGAGKPLNVASSGNLTLRAGPVIGNNYILLTLDNANKTVSISIRGVSALTLTQTGLTAPLHASNGATGSFTVGGKTVTVIDGIITGIA